MDFFVPLKGSTAPSFASATLVLPQPSLASLAQLACDLIVHNYRLDLVGYLALSDHVPAVGARDRLPGQDAQHGIALGCEVYATPSRSLFIALPRSPVIRARRANYLESMQRWVAESGFKEVLIVAGADAAMRGDDGLNAITPLRQLVPTAPNSTSPSPSTASPLFTSLRRISPSHLSTAPSGFQTASEAAAADAEGAHVPPIPHGGLARPLLTTLAGLDSDGDGDGAPGSEPAPAAADNVGALIVYTSEGAASESAHFLADALAYLLEAQLADLEDRIERAPPAHTTTAGVESREGRGEGAAGEEVQQGSEKGNVRWKEPVSWERGLLGPELARDAGMDMYG